MIRAIINVMFNIIGRAADNANLLCEFKIDEQIEEILISIKKGKIIREILTSSLNFSLSFTKPGAKIVIKNGIKISMIRTTIDDTIKKIKTILPANLFDSCIKLFLISLVYIGTKAEFNAPSEKILLNVFGILKATKKISDITPAPKKLAINISLRKPNILLIDVNKEKISEDLKTFI